MSDFLDPKRLHYDERNVIGSGSFGVILAGELADERGGGRKKVALKQQSPGPAISELERSLFVKELNDTISTSRQCDCVVQCYGYSILRSGQLCLVMRLYERGTLFSLIDDLQLDEQKLSPQEVACIGADITRGLQQVHRLGLLAEDIKPGNVLIGSDGRAVLADFGGSKHISPHASRVSTRAAVGTLIYTAPEKLEADGDDRYRFGKPSDVWSMGITLLQLALTDALAPYGPGKGVANLIRQLNMAREPPEVPALPELPGLQRLIQRCLQIDPSARITSDELAQSMEEVRGRLCPRSGGEDITTLKAKLQQADHEKAVMQKKLADAEAGLAREVSAKLKLQEEKPKAQGLTKLTTGTLSSLQSLLSGANGPGCTVDLCGRTLDTPIVGDLVLPSCSTLKNGTLVLQQSSCVKVPGDRACFLNIVIKGAGAQKVCVWASARSSSLEMEGCHIEGGLDQAVRVGAGASLCAQRCSIQSSKGTGLAVCDGAWAKLEHVTAGSCGLYGVRVVGESMVSAAHCDIDGNGRSNILVGGGSRACLQHCSSNGSREAHGWCVQGQSTLMASDCVTSSNKSCGASCAEGSTASLSRVTANKNGSHGWYVQGKSSVVSSGSVTSSNKSCGAWCGEGSTASLSRVTANENGQHGWQVEGKSSLLAASDSVTSSNKWSGAAAFSGSSATLSACTAKGNERSGWHAQDPGTSLVVKSCQAQDNIVGNTREHSGGRIFCLDV